MRSVLGEFESFNVSNQNPYGSGHQEFAKAPVAILGAREYIFSENIGILGDVAAGKEQTFGTMAGRGLAQIGGKLHYGHPDFLNTIFMTTRGGVSKAQKGLHLNEDIYAGMTAFVEEAASSTSSTTSVARAVTWVSARSSTSPPSSATNG